MIEQKNVTNDIMIEHVKNLYENRQKLDAMSVSAAELAVRDTNDRIYAVIEELMALKK